MWPYLAGFRSELLIEYEPIVVSDYSFLCLNYYNYFLLSNNLKYGPDAQNTEILLLAYTIA